MVPVVLSAVLVNATQNILRIICIVKINVRNLGINLCSLQIRIYIKNVITLVSLSINKYNVNILLKKKIGCL